MSLRRSRCVVDFLKSSLARQLFPHALDEHVTSVWFHSRLGVLPLFLTDSSGPISNRWKLTMFSYSAAQVYLSSSRNLAQSSVPVNALPSIGVLEQLIPDEVSCGVRCSFPSIEHIRRSNDHNVFSS